MVKLNFDSDQTEITKAFNEFSEKTRTADNDLIKTRCAKKPFLRKGAGLQRYKLDTFMPKASCRLSTVKTTPCISVSPKINNKSKAFWQLIDNIPNSNIEEGSFRQESNCNQKASETIQECSIQQQEIARQTSRFLVSQQGDDANHSIDQDLKIFEALEERANTSSFCSTNSSIREIFASTAYKTVPPLSFDGWPTKGPIHLNSQVKEIHNQIDFLNCLRQQTKGDLSRTVSECSDIEISSLNLTIVSDQFDNCEQNVEKVIAANGIEPKPEIYNESIQSDDHYCKNCETLQKRFSKLNQKISQNVTEDADVCDFLNKVEKAWDDMCAEWEVTKEKHKQEVLNLKHQLAEQKQKYLKEKMVFKNYDEKVLSRTVNQDRLEIYSLRKELTDAQELLKLRDIKNGTCQARLRNQIKELSRENRELKEEIQKLTKEKAKLSAKVSQNQNIRKWTGGGKKCNKDLSVNETVIPAISNKTCTEKSSQLPTNVLQNTIENFPNSFKSTCNTKNNEQKKIEIIYDDGTKEIKYTNGNIKTISPDGKVVILKYYNGDIKETNLTNNTLKYFYGASQTWHTEYNDGSELVVFPDGRSQKTNKAGECEINYPDGVKQLILPSGEKQITYLDGSMLFINEYGEKTFILPNGQKEIHTHANKRREYTDGTIKVLNADGSQETRYSDGRIRRKNAQGALVMDSVKTIL